MSVCCWLGQRVRVRAFTNNKATAHIQPKWDSVLVVNVNVAN